MAKVIKTLEEEKDKIKVKLDKREKESVVRFD